MSDIPIEYVLKIICESGHVDITVFHQDFGQQFVENYAKKLCGEPPGFGPFGVPLQPTKPGDGRCRECGATKLRYITDMRWC